jgi:hypothetical protein
MRDLWDDKLRCAGPLQLRSCSVDGQFKQKCP